MAEGRSDSQTVRGGRLGHGAFGDDGGCQRDSKWLPTQGTTDELQSLVPL